MAVIGTLPNNIQNGQLEDATAVMANFNFIVNQVNASANPVGTLTAPSGTRMAFQQAAAPLGWVQDTSAAMTDTTMRVVNTAGGGTGGAAAYSLLFLAGGVTDGHALTTAELANHVHGVTDNGHNHADAGHQHLQNAGTYYNITGATIAGPGTVQLAQSTQVTQVGQAVIQPSVTGIAVQAAGSGTAHSHTLTLNTMYADVIVCQKT